MIRRMMSSSPTHVKTPLVLLGLIAIASLARVPGLEQVPPLLNQDEASRGYDAWSLIEIGADRHGASWPFFLESFGPGDYTAALSTYLTMPFVAVLGPTAFAMRLPDAILGVLTVGVVYFWLRRRFGETFALVAAGVLAVDPWHIALSRTAHESGFAPFFMAMGLLAMDRAGLLFGEECPASPSPRRAWVWAFVAGLMLAAHTWIYPATRAFTPLWLLALACLCGRSWWTLARKRETRFVLVSAALGLVIGAMPILLTALFHPEQLAARASATVLIYQDLPIASIVFEFVANLAANLDPRYWFVQSDEMSGATIPLVGQHLLIWAPLFLAGLVSTLAGCRRSAWRRFLIVWLLIYPIPAAICNDWNPHPMRTVGGMLLFPIITAAGFHAVARWFSERHQRHAKLGLSLLVILLVINLGHFANAYYRRFPPLAEPTYQTGLVRAMQFVAEQSDEAEFVLVTNRAVQPYIYALLLEPVSPESLQANPPIIAAGPRGFHQVIRVGKYVFTPQDPVAFPEAASAFQQALAELPVGAVGFVIERAGHFHAGELVRTFPVGDTANASDSYEVRRWRLGEAATNVP